MDGDSGCSWVGWGRSLVLNLLGSSFDVAVIFLEKIPRKIGDVVEDFELVREEFVAEYASQARLWKHKKTGTELLSILNADENKTFGIVFRTPPKDSTGVPHILEHSVSFEFSDPKDPSGTVSHIFGFPRCFADQGNTR